MNKVFLIIGFILMLLGFGYFINSVNTIANLTMHNETIECFDSHNNLINGVYD